MSSSGVTREALAELEAVAELIELHYPSLLTYDHGATWTVACNTCDWKTASDLQLRLREAEKARLLHAADVVLKHVSGSGGSGE